jgi:catechol 2,3-dioxygenase-like lactoylglutathione lyase family enzyme
VGLLVTIVDILTQALRRSKLDDAPIEENEMAIDSKSGERIPTLNLNGVDHTARPTWKLRETVEFYRDKLGLPLVHAITAKGWGRTKEAHADFIHFFFDAGKGSTIAFFYYIGTDQPPELMVPLGYMGMANHTAWRVETKEELLAWQKRLEAVGVQVSQSIKHEILESIYFRDPNHYPLEITRPLRAVERIDGMDAELTMAAALELADGGGWENIEQLWRLKAKHVDAHQQSADALS